MQPKDATFFQPKASFEIIETVLPHWDQPGAFAFVTFRLKDSLPAEAISRWRMQRDAILRESGIDPRRLEASLRKKKTEQNSNATAAITKHLSPRAASLLKWKLFLVWDNELDAFHGSSCLRDSQASQIISDGLLKFHPVLASSSVNLKRTASTRAKETSNRTSEANKEDSLRDPRLVDCSVQETHDYRTVITEV
jgi:hypothetical protein